MINENKIQLESDKSEFNLNCLSPNDFPLVNENFTDNEFLINSQYACKNRDFSGTIGVLE